MFSLNPCKTLIRADFNCCCGIIIVILQNGDSLCALLEITGNNGLVRVNGKTIQKNSSVYLQEGDKVEFNSSEHHYVSFFENCLFVIMYLLHQLMVLPHWYDIGPY